MTERFPDPTPEGILVGEATRASGRSVRSLAREAGISEARWRQIVQGFAPARSGGVAEPAVPKTATLAKIALVLGLTPHDLKRVGRVDAADWLTILVEHAATQTAELVHWRTLRGADLDQAMLDSHWFVQPDDLIGGWAVTVTDEPPSAGYPQVAGFLSERAARHIVELHNAARDRRVTA